MRRLVLAAFLLGGPCVARAQAASPDSLWQGWLYLAAGPSAANGQSRIGGDLGVWVTHNGLAFSARTATASRLLETGEIGDVALLAGIHPHAGEYSDIVLGAGPGVNRGRGTGGEVLPSALALALAAQANLNVVAVGIGIDAFASLAPKRQVVGIGVALMLGRFR